MKTTLWRGLIAGAAMIVVAAACDDNPVDEGVDQVARVSFSKAFASVAPGDSIKVAATPLNRYGNPLGSGVTFAACSNKVSIATSSRDDADLAEAINVWIKGTTDLGNLGYTCVTAASGGVTDTIQILVVPPYLIGSASSGLAGDTVVLMRSQGQPAFDGDVRVRIVEGTPPNLVHNAFWLREQSTADELYVVVPLNVPAGDHSIEVSNIGAGQNTLAADYEVTGMATYADESDPDVTLPFEVVGTLDASDGAGDDYYIDAAADADITCVLESDVVNGSNIVFYLFQPTYTSGSGLYDYNYDWDTGIADYTYAFYSGSNDLWVRNYVAAGPTSYHIYCPAPE